MKIGILTFHCACNYGAVLQCYALQEYLSSCGHDVKVIDYRPASVTGGYRCFDIRRFWGATPCRFYSKTKKELSVIRARKFRYSAFARFVESRLPLTPRVRNERDAGALAGGFDMVIVGSDQVWNPRITGGIDPMYWGDFDHGHSSIISYAASMEDGFSSQVEEAVRKYLPSFKAISVREDQLRDSITSVLPSSEVATVVDPVLLLTSSQWDRLPEGKMPEYPYLLYYQVRRSPKAYEIAQTEARRMGLELVCLSAKVELENSDEVISSSPEDFVSLFRNASFVVTTSFHGTAFSVLFHKEFVCVDVADGKGSRQRHLLEGLGLSDRIVSTIPEYPMPSVEWQDVERRLDVMRQTSIDFLKSAGL